MVNNEILGENIKTYRRLNNISQEKLGELLSKSHAAVSDMERGKTDITVQDLLKISKYLGVPFQTLLANTKIQQFSGINHNRITKESVQEPTLNTKDIEIIRSMLIEETKKAIREENDKSK